MRTDPIAYTVPDAIRVSGISRTKLYELINNGHLTKTKVGRRTLIPADALRRVVTEGVA